MLKKIFPIFFCLTTSAFFAISQNNGVNSPYSRYGIGDVLYNRTSKNISMGGLSYGLRSSNTVNFGNPASYTSFDTSSIVFNIGIINTYCKLQTDTLSQQTNNTTFSNLLFGFPVTHWWSGSIGLVPYSNIGYKISDKENIDNIGNVEYFYKGSGGINKFYIGNSFRILKNFSAGFNASYIFGTLNFIRTVTFLDISNIYNYKIVNSTNVGDFHFDFGLQYQIKLKKDWLLTLGFVYNSIKNENAKIDTFSTTFINKSGYSYTRDTIINVSDVKGKITFPSSYGIGFILSKSNKFLVGGDFAIQNWSKYKYFGQDDSLINSVQICLGSQYIPNANAIKGYIKKIHYNLGIRYANTYLQLKNTKLTEYGITFGFDLPLRKTNSLINLGFEIGQRGTIKNDLIKETYVRAALSFSFCDMWFLRQKYY
ncbi:MAG: hypothetical protein PHD97_04170 [Bacteroidales bacterium]|nr:hypothetical protein [Bacteroidales bacterium]